MALGKSIVFMSNTDKTDAVITYGVWGSPPLCTAVTELYHYYYLYLYMTTKYLGYVFYIQLVKHHENHTQLLEFFLKVIHPKLCAGPLMRITFSIIKIRIAIFKETMGFKHNSN